MKRRIFSVLLSSALLLTALAGCGQGGEAAPSGSSSDADSETGTRDELIFVNYRDIRDLNPHLYAGEMYAPEHPLRHPGEQYGRRLCGLSGGRLDHQR